MRASNLLSVRALRGSPLTAQDGEMGSIVDLYFDDERWDVRYLVVDTGHQMPRREVLIPRTLLQNENPEDDAVHVRLTRAQVEKSPDVDTQKPVSRQHELTYAARAASNPHLRSGEIVIGYGVRALDGAIGHVEDLVLDKTTWRIASLVVVTRKWLPGTRLLISPQAVLGIDWIGRKVDLRLTRERLGEASETQFSLP